MRVAYKAMIDEGGRQERQKQTREQESQDEKRIFDKSIDIYHKYTVLKGEEKKSITGDF